MQTTNKQIDKTSGEGYVPMLVSQKELSGRVNQKCLENLKSSATEAADRARLASLCLSHSGDWLYVVPCPALGLHLKGPEFRVATLYRLGAPVFSSSGPCIACGVQSDMMGHHSISCGSQGERIARHNHL